LPLIALQDLAAFARIIFEDRERWSGQTLGVTSDFASGEKIVKTLTEVAGVPAVYVPCTGEEYASRIPWASQPVAKTDVDGPTHADNWLMWWRIYEDDLILPEKDPSWAEDSKNVDEGAQLRWAVEGASERP
jgi:hypothetical protein